MTQPRARGCVLGVVADGMGGKSGGRKASDQVLLVSRQLFDRFVPSDDPAEMLRQIVTESHLMIKLTAISSEQEPHSTLATFLIQADLRCDVAHAGDSRVYHFRGAEVAWRTKDHSYVQRLVDEGRLSPAEAENHPQSNLLVGCLGASADPPIALHRIDALQVGDSMMACSDGVWHYFTSGELGAMVQSMPPREAAEAIIAKARERARGGGDNLSLALVRVEAA